MSSEYFYVAACGTDEQSGIYQMRMQNGHLKKLSFIRQKCASYLAFSEDKSILYAALEGSTNGGLAAYGIKEDGSLEKISELLTPGDGFCHLEVAPGGKFVYVANYGSGQVASFNVENNNVSDYKIVATHTGSGTHQIRQKSAHVHFTRLSPDMKYLLVVDLGIDQVLAYPLAKDGSFAKKQPKISKIAPGGSGPRHFIFRKDGKVAYLLNELANTVMTLDYNDGKFTIRQTLPTVPESMNCFSKASAIRLSKDEKYLLASNRGYDTIATFKVANDGSIAPHALDFIGGKAPRDFNFLPGDDMIFVGGEESNNAFLFDFNKKTGRMSPGGIVITKMPRPICILPHN